MTRKALGRGLSALLQEAESTPAAGVQELPIELIEPNPLQPRRTFAEESLKELAASIQTTGVVQPILARRLDDGRYQLVAGERRWRAARLAGLNSVPVVLRELTDREALEIALTENLLREDLNQVEIARAYEALQTKFDLSHEHIAIRLGINRSTVTNTLRLLKLPASVQTMIEEGSLSAGHARALLAIESEEAQQQLAQMIVKRGLSVRQTEKLAATPGRERRQTEKEEAEPPPDPNTRAAVLEMERALGTRVRVTGDGQRGRIEISYFSAEDLDRIYQRLVNSSMT